MPACQRCLEPLGDEAIVMKSGLAMCPSCFQKKYGKQASSDSGSSWIYISSGTMLGGLLVVVLGVGCYFAYSYSRESLRQEQLTAERNEKLRKEEAAANDARQQKYEEQKRATDAMYNARIEREGAAARAAAAAEKKIQEERLAAIRKEDERKLAEREQKQKDEEKKQADLAQAEADRQKMQERIAMNKDLYEANQRREAEVVKLLNTLEDSATSYLKCRDERVVKDRTYQAKKSIFTTRKNSCETMYCQYTGARLGSPSAQEAWTKDWQPTYLAKIRNYGSSSVSTENEAIPIAAKFNAASKEARDSFAAMEEMKKDMDKLDKTMADAEVAFKSSEKSLIEILGPDAFKKRRSPRARLDAAVEPGIIARNPKFKTLGKKDGKTIQIQAMIASDTEISYKDEDGKRQVIQKSEVDRIEDNNAPSERDLTPGSKNSGSVGF